MKLKKIASLMLAGVMAVSMLAGCNTVSNGGNNGGEGEGEGQVSTSNSSTVLHDTMKGDARKMTTPAANANLDSALKQAVDTYFNNEDYLDVLTGSSVMQVKYGKVVENLEKALNAKSDIAAGLNYLLNNDETTIAVELYCVEASVSDTYALEQVANKVENDIAGLKDKSNNGEYSYAYTVSASIVTKPLTSSIVEGVTGGVKYIAVAVTQTPTKVV